MSKQTIQYAEMDALETEALAEAMRRVRSKAVDRGEPGSPYVDLVAMVGAVAVLLQQHLDVARQRLALARAAQERTDQLAGLLMAHPVMRTMAEQTPELNERRSLLMNSIYGKTQDGLVFTRHGELVTLRPMLMLDPDRRVRGTVMLTREEMDEEGSYILEQFRADAMGLGINRDELEAY